MEKKGRGNINVTSQVNKNFNIEKNNLATKKYIGMKLPKTYFIGMEQRIKYTEGENSAENAGIAS